MRFTPLKILAYSVCLAIFASGCSPTKPLYLNDGRDLSFYVEQATKIDYPDVNYFTLDEVTQAHRPMTVIDPDFSSYEDITLQSAISFALSNSKIIRGYGTPGLQATRVSPGQDGLANGPSAATTTYDIAIRQTEPGFIGQPGQISNPASITTNGGLDGNQGEEAALAEFDAQLSSSFTYTKSNEPRNSIPTSPLNNQIFQQDQVTWQSEVAKKSANGTQIFFRNINQYTSNNNPLVATGGLQVLDSFYRTSFEAELRQPLLRGRGTYINRMPIVISRIGTDQQIANLDATLQNKVTNVEIRYWDLYLAYRNFEAAKTGRKAALETWRIVKLNFEGGADKVTIQSVAQASGQYHFFDSQVIDTYNNVLNAEGQLRYLLGWASTDGRFLRPIDEPVMAPVEFDWCTSLCEALTYRPELRQQRWEIKKKELALAYSKNGLLPELNVSLLYRWLGLGNKYGTSGNSQDFPGAESAALNELYGGNFQELQFGGTFAMPIGFRRELANVRNAQLKLARELARVEDMELDITKELSEAMRALAANQMVMHASFNQWKDTKVEEDHFKRLEEYKVETLDIALEAQRRRAQAEVAFYVALCEYNKVIALIHRRKGTILAYCGVSLSEGPWPGKAYTDAQEHARRRGASRQINYGWSRPQVVSRGENWPTANNTGNIPSAVAKSASVTSAERFDVAPIGEIPAGMIPNQDAIPFSERTDPYYQAPTNSSGAIPTPAFKGSNSRTTISSNFRQVDYVEDVPIVTAAQLKAGLRRQSSDGTPVASPGTSKAIIVNLSVPKRDNSSQPTNRLKAKTPLAGSQAGESRSTNGRAVLRTGNLAWEKLGLKRPEQSTGRSTARIKIN